MDITFKTEDGTFNLRVCAMMLHDGRILAMKDERSPYYYLPGGRVKLGEELEKAVLREVAEELGVEGEIVRPLWVNQGFFTEDVSGEKYHELCVYYLVDITQTGLPELGERFERFEQGRRNRFEWLAFERLKDEYFYPVFLREKIWELPSEVTFLANCD